MNESTVTAPLASASGHTLPPQMIGSPGAFSLLQPVAMQYCVKNLNSASSSSVTEAGCLVDGMGDANPVATREAMAREKSFMLTVLSVDSGDDG